MGEQKKYGRILKRKLFFKRYRDGILGTVLFLGLVLMAAGWSFWNAWGREAFLLPHARQTVALPVGEGFSGSISQTDPDSIPDYAGEDFIVLNQDIPAFSQYDLQNRTGESYSELDDLGRCGSAVALLHRSMMPAKERESIGEIRPSGWVQEKYEGVVNASPPYLYNRCHLIAYGLTGQNANEKNLITGTRYMNAESMLEMEKRVMKYLDDSEYHVLYRVTPLFRGEELVARGVEMEACSVEDMGEGLCFHVFVYNYQPGIEIDYLTGQSRRTETAP